MEAKKTFNPKHKDHKWCIDTEGALKVWKNNDNGTRTVASLGKTKSFSYISAKKTAPAMYKWVTATGQYSLLTRWMHNELDGCHNMFSSILTAKHVRKVESSNYYYYYF